MAEKNIGIPSPELRFSDEQHREFDRLLKQREAQRRANQSRSAKGTKTEITNIYLDLSEEQKKAVTKILYGLYHKWELIYQFHMADILRLNKSDLEELKAYIPAGMTVEDTFVESDLSTDELYSVFWGFHNHDGDTRETAGNIVMYENLGTIIQKLQKDVVNKKKVYERRDDISYQTDDIFAPPLEFFQQVTADMLSLYDRYDIRKGYYFNTLLTGSIGYSINAMQKYEHPMSLTADEQRMRRNVRKAFEALGYDADDGAVLAFLQEEARKEQEGREKKKHEQKGRGKRGRRSAADEDEASDDSLDIVPAIIEIPELRRAMDDVRNGSNYYTSLDKKIGGDEESSLSDFVPSSATSEGYGNPLSDIIEKESGRDLILAIESKLERMSRVMLSCILDAYEWQSSGRRGQTVLTRLYSGKKPPKRTLSTQQAIKRGAIAAFRRIYRDANEYSAEVFFDKVYSVMHGEVWRVLEPRTKKGGVPAALNAIGNYDDTYRRFAEDMLYEENAPVWTAQKEDLIQFMEEKHSDDPDEDF